MSLRIDPVGYAAAAHLVAELDADLGLRYPGGDSVRAHPGQFDPAEGGGFFVASLDGAEAGCAGFRREDERAAEVKRMWVRTGARRRGVAQALLTACEDAARALGYAELWLETGTGQPEAMALYAAAGYTPVAPFGQFRDARDARHLGRSLR